MTFLAHSVEMIHLTQYGYCLLVNSYRKWRNFEVVAKRMASRRQLNRRNILGLQGTTGPRKQNRHIIRVFYFLKNMYVFWRTLI